MADDGISPESLELIHKRLHADYKWLASQVPGKRILRHLYMKCGQGETSFMPGQPDATQFKEGRRSIWLAIESALRWKPDQREKFLQEED